MTKSLGLGGSGMLAPWHRLKIGMRLGLAFLGVFVLMTAMAVFAILRMHEMNERMVHITQGNAEQIARVNTMIYSVSQRAIALRNLAMQKDAEARKPELQAIEESAKQYRQAEKELLELIERFDASEAEKALLEAIKRSENATVALMAQAEALAVAGKSQEAAEFLVDKVRPRQARWITVLQTLSGLQLKTSGEYAQDAATAYQKASNLLIVFVCVALLAGVVLAWLVTRGITAPIREAVRIARIAATGDLTARSSMRRGDETGELLDALRAMNDNLTRVVDDVRTGSETIATGSREIATGNTDLSKRTEQQATSLQQTAASMEEIRSTVRTNADTASKASEMAAEATAVAEQGGNAVTEVVRTMEKISVASKRIADIIGVIDGIAFQTNILALNAAVEAARAGEQGRGFAVVAGEVRSLAQRSSEAAREIRGLIGTNVASVDEGSRQVADAGARMEDIVNQIRRVSTLIGEISNATREQTAGIDQVSDAVSNLDQVTQQNAALVEQSAAAADSLRQQAAKLLESVAVFKHQSSYV